MMKKLRVLPFLILAMPIWLKAQAPTTATVVTDTLSYYFNKQYFKNPSPLGVGFPFHKSPSATNTAVTHVGSVFLNTDTALRISGLEGRMAYQNNSAAQQIPVRLYLCNVDANLKPVFPPIDSVYKLVGNAQDHAFSPSGYPVSGTFTNSSGPVSHKVPGNFAILMRNLSPIAGDTVRLYRTNGRVPGSPGYNNNTAIGEGFGVVRYAGNFYSTKNFTLSNSFGMGTDYEFCVSPIVTFSLYADHIVPAKVNSDPADSVMCWEPLTFTNTSSPHWTNRFFNLTEFQRHFVPFVNTPPGGFSPDAPISWYFDDEDIDYPLLRPNIILAIGATTATKYYDTAGCFTSCSMRARYRKMTAGGTGEIIQANIEFSVCVAYIGGCEYVGMTENELDQVKLYPNPSADGKCMISGLNGTNTIQIYDVLGSLVATLVSREEKVTVDLLDKPGGTYLIRVSDENQRHRNMKLVYMKD